MQRKWAEMILNHIQLQRCPEVSVFPVPDDLWLKRMSWNWSIQSRTSIEPSRFMSLPAIKGPNNLEWLMEFPEVEIHWKWSGVHQFYSWSASATKELCLTSAVSPESPSSSVTTPHPASSSHCCEVRMEEWRFWLLTFDFFSVVEWEQIHCKRYSDFFSFFTYENWFVQGHFNVESKFSENYWLVRYCIDPAECKYVTRCHSMLFIPFLQPIPGQTSLPAKRPGNRR